MKKRYFVALAVLLALPACGGGASVQYHDDVEPQRAEDVQLLSEQVAADERLSEELARPEPDCGAACELGAAICDLGERICTIARRNSRSPEIASRCRDATARCESAHTRIAERCTCEE